MLCKNPFMGGATPFGCGQCLPCRINRRRQWMWRQYLESLEHEENCFVTLTYADEHLPTGANLQPAHLQKFLKRLRKAIAPHRIRYFAVGEYGEVSLRPHYHISLFGLSGRTDVVGRSLKHYGSAATCATHWTFGNVYLAEFNEQTAQYIAGYVTKKLADRMDPRMSSLVPEFARMSNRPGIGANTMARLAKALENQSITIDKNGDVPNELKVGRRSIPLGRYLLQKLREGVGFTPDYIKHIKNLRGEKNSQELLTLFKVALDASPAEPITQKQVYAQTVEQKIRNTEARAAIWKKRGSI